jgi:hypothetical protein
MALFNVFGGGGERNLVAPPAAKLLEVGKKGIDLSGVEIGVFVLHQGQQFI